MARNPENRPLIAKVISPQNYLNQPETVVMQVLTGKFADGLGNVQNVPDRIDFNPIPWYSMATWMLTQMQRWGYVKGDVNYKDISEKVFLLTDARKYMQETNAPITAQAKASTGNPKFKIMGREFDPATAAAYSKSFAISKT
ncbi:MAG: nitrate ABC transporter substrate-binding protein, partial [Burkholderiaceae bacterium]|jgi:nitrate/nitrite transport system substrate-binding protein|nr:nitrate ABC transporter substrate-binding protein [Burkholderiaceae bacterium]